VPPKASDVRAASVRHGRCRPSRDDTAPIDPLLERAWRQRQLERDGAVATTPGPSVGRIVEHRAPHRPSPTFSPLTVVLSLVLLAIVVGALTDTSEQASRNPTGPAAASAGVGSGGGDAAPAEATPLGAFGNEAFDPDGGGGGRVGEDVVKTSAVSDPVPDQIRQLLDRRSQAGLAWPAPECQWLLPHLSVHGLPDWMLAVAWRESRCRADVRNHNLRTRDDSWGLFQINALGSVLRAELRQTCGIDDPERLLDADTSLRCAGALYARYGYRPWHAGRYFT